ELAGPHAPDLLRGDEPGPLQDADVLLHAREGHVELHGEVRDRSVCTSELLQNAASGGVRERAERGIEAGSFILNHWVQDQTRRTGACKSRRAALATKALPLGLEPQIQESSRCNHPRPSRRRPPSAAEPRTAPCTEWCARTSRPYKEQHYAAWVD